MAENIEPSKPKVGTWANMNTEVSDRNPRVEFEINIAKTVVFTSNDPKEMTSKEDPNSVYYIFDCEENAEPKVIMTSAWTLLKALKMLSPLAGKKVTIVKKVTKGKQEFIVTENK
jgi:hypothetical protein